jgi:hypothetical protein
LDENCDLSVCLCPNENNLPVSCDWVSGEQITSTLKCYDENGTCWVTVEPTSAFSNLDQGIGKPQVVVATSEGKTYTSVDLENNNNGCIFDSDRISCLLSSGGTFNANTVSDIYMCMDMCCVNLGKMAAGDVVVQSGNCPGSGNLEVRDFKLNEGVLSIQLRNSLGWDADSLEVFLDDAKGDHWSTLTCKIDNKYNNIMNCQGWAVYKSGFATLSFYYGSGSDACSVTGVRFQIPEMTPAITISIIVPPAAPAAPPEELAAPADARNWTAAKPAVMSAISRKDRQKIPCICGDFLIKINVAIYWELFDRDSQPLQILKVGLGSHAAAGASG